MTGKVILTPARKAALTTIRELSDKGKAFTKTQHRVTQPTLEFLLREALIAAHGPFAGIFHTVVITDKGRQVLANGGK